MLIHYQNCDFSQL